MEQVAKNSDYNFNGVDAPKNQTSYYGLRYATFVVPLVKAIQEQQEMIDKQQDEVSKLNIKIEQLESALNAQQKNIDILLKKLN